MVTRRIYSISLVFLIIAISCSRASIQFGFPSSYSNNYVGGVNQIAIPISGFNGVNSNDASTNPFCIQISFSSSTFSFGTNPTLTFVNLFIKVAQKSIVKLQYQKKQTYGFTQSSTNVQSPNSMIFCYNGVPNTPFNLLNDTLTLSSLVNPNFSGNYNFQIQTTDTQGNAYLTTNDFFGFVRTPPIPYSPLPSITTFSIKSTSGQVYSAGLTLTINSVLAIPANSLISITFPTNWENFCCPVIDSTLSNLSCVLINFINSSCTSSSSGVNSTITMKVIQNLEANSNQIIVINGVRAPPSSDTYVNNFQLTVANSTSTGFMYNLLSTQIPPLTIANTLNVVTGSFSPSIIVNQIADSQTFNVQINLSTPVTSANYMMELDLPFNLATTLTSNSAIIGSGICNPSIPSSSYAITVIAGTSSYRITFQVGSIFQLYQSSLPAQSCTLQIPKVQGGPYINYSGQIAARTYKSNSIFIDQGNQIFNRFNLLPNPISRQTLTTTTSQVGAQGSYTFSFDISDPLSSNAIITIDYSPNTVISLASSTCTVSCSRGCNPSTSCVITQNNKIITLSSIFQIDFTNVSSINQMTINIVISNVLNPLSVVTPAQANNFIINTFYGNNQLVQNTQLGTTTATLFSSYTPISITTLGISASNSIVRQNVGTLTVSFTFNQFTLMAGAIYTLTFPPNSFFMQNSPTPFQAVWSGTTQQLTQTNWDIANGNIVMTTQYTPVGSVSFTIQGNILNPAQTTKQYTISLKITDSSGNLVANSSPSTGFYSVANLDSTSSNLAVSADNQQNSYTPTTYTFTISNPSQISMLQGFYVYITLPTFQGIPLALNSCTSGTTTISACLQDPNNSQRYYTTIQTASTTQPINFKMILTNYISLAQITFIVLVTESTTSNQIYQTQVNYANTIQSQLDFTAIPNLFVSDLIVTYTITLKTTTPQFIIPTNIQIIISFPQQFNQAQLQQAQVIGQCTVQSITGYNIQLTSTAQGINSIQISNIYNPGPYVQQSDQFMIQINDQNGKGISQSIVSSTRKDIRFVFNCDISCRTCDSIDNTKCLTCYNDRFLQSNKCVLQCDPGYYKQGQSCTQCNNNCNTCQSDTICVTCQTGYLFVPATNQCVQSCGSLQSYYQSQQQCLPCDSKCYTCTDSQTCQSCNNSYYFVAGQNKCVDQAGCNNLGLFTKANQCVLCESPCATCLTTYNTCTSCLSGQPYIYLQGNSCQAKCNASFYSDGGNKCQQCDGLCTTCTGQSRNCQSCISTAGFYQNKCFSTCPSNVPLNIDGNCTPCPNNCATCSSLDVCQTCVGSNLLFKNQCIASCPVNYQPDSTATKCVLQDINTIITRNLDQNKFVPFPYLISLVIWIAIAFCSRNRAHQTFLSGCVVGIGGVIEFATWVTFFILQTINDSMQTPQNKLFLAALILHFLFNIINLAFYFIYMRKDTHFIYWLSQIQNKICHGFIRFFSLTFTHKFENFMFSKFFGFSFFSAKLTTVHQLLPYNIVAGLSMIFVNVPMIVAASATIYYDDQFEQMFIEGLEVIIINLILIGFMIANTKKPEDYFITKIADGVNPLVANISNRDNLPYNSKLMASFTKTNFGMSGGADSDRGEFKFTNRVTVIEDLEKPLTFGYKLNNQSMHQAANMTKGPNANNMNLSYINGKNELTANDQSIDFINQNMTNKNFYKNQDSSIQGSVYGNGTNPELYFANPNSIHQTQELGEQCSKGRRLYESKSIPKMGAIAQQPIQEQLEDDDDDFGEDNLHTKLQMTGEDMNMRRVDLMNQNYNGQNNQYQTMRSARSIQDSRISQNVGYQGYGLYQNQQSSLNKPLNSSRPPSYIMDNTKTEKKVPMRQNNGGSKVMTPTRQNTMMQSQNQMTTSNNLQTQSPHLAYQQRNYSQNSAKITPKRSVSIGVNEQDLLESSIYPSNYQKSTAFDKKLANRSTKEQSYMSPVRTMQNTKEINFQSHVSARSRSRSASPQRPPNELDQEYYKKMNNMRSKSKDQLDYYDESEHPEYLEGNIDRLNNRKYQTKNPNHIQKFNGQVISPESSPDKSSYNAYDDQNRMNSKINTEEIDLLRGPSIKQNSQMIEKVGSDDSDQNDEHNNPNSRSRPNQLLFYLQNPMQRPVDTPLENNRRLNTNDQEATNQQQQELKQSMMARKISSDKEKEKVEVPQDSKRVERMQPQIEDLDVNEYDPYGLKAQASEKMKKMQYPSNRVSQQAIDHKKFIKKPYETEEDLQSDAQNIESQRLDESSDQPPVINQHRMIAPPIIHGETIHSNSSPIAQQRGQVVNDPAISQLSQQLQGSQKNIKTSMRSSLEKSETKNNNTNNIKPPLNPMKASIVSDNKNQQSDSDDEENLINNINKKRSIDHSLNGNLEPNSQNNNDQESKVRQLLIRQSKNSNENINTQNQADEAGLIALNQVRVVTPMTTMINPRDLQKIEFANKGNNNKPLRESQQGNQIVDTQTDDNLIQKSKELDSEFLRQRQKLSQIVNAEQLNEELQRKPSTQNQSKENIRQSNQFKSSAQQIIPHEQSKTLSPSNNQNKASKQNNVRSSLQQPFYNMQDAYKHHRSTNHNESLNRPTDFSAAKTENLDIQPVNLDDFNGGGLYSHQTSMNIIGNQQPNSNIPQILKDNSTISPISNTYKVPQAFNLGNPSSGDLSNNFFGLSAKEYEEYTLNKNNTISKPSPTNSRVANQYYQENPMIKDQIKKRRNVDDIYDSQESIKSASEAQIDFNEISPSDFNVLNQRYDEDIVEDEVEEQKSQMLKKAISQAPSYYDATNEHDERLMAVANLNNLKKLQTNDASLPPHIQQSRKSDVILGQTSNQQQNLRGNYPHSDTNSMVSINQPNFNYMQQQHPVIITSHNYRMTGDAGSRNQTDNIRNLSESRSNSQYNRNNGQNSESHTPYYYNIQNASNKLNGK
ncbi:hypothetical protein ABPG72_010881 [Tetrahymena utriculariae]